ncbi:unnamed protein product [Clavelina lepadiformis]|uniref:LCCL domain-containing protein n=1 Tax=Clavelina lepadiformis TaxID=159417 RepID=A0ABP0FIT4_CLALP
MHRILLSVTFLMVSMGVDAGGFGDDDKILTSLDIDNPHVVSEVLTTTAVSCYVVAGDIQGDVLTMLCPGGCEKVTEKLYGTKIYSDESYVCAAAIHDGRISGKDGGKITIRKTRERKSFRGSTAFGLTSKSAKDSYGSFIFLDAFDGRQSLYSVSCLAKGEFTSEKDFLIICPGGCDALRGGVTGSELYSPDSYLCAAGIHAGKIDAFSGGRLIVHRLSGGEEYKGSFRNGIQSSDGPPTTSSIMMQECPQDLSGIVSIGCSLRADHFMEEVFNVICPPGCSQIFSNVIGKGPYSVKSTVCGAAIHDGLIEETLGGRVTVHKIPGDQTYQGVRRNGITSGASTSVEKGFVVQDSIQPFPSLLEVTCETPASAILEETFTVFCPVGCDLQQIHSVWGSDVYTHNSSICLAAIHNGFMSGAQGGPVTVRKLGGQTSFVGSTQNGIQSRDVTSSDPVKAFVLGGNMEEVKSALTVSCGFNALSTFGLEFTIRCPKTCSEQEAMEPRAQVRRVLGMDEPICKAASDVAGKVITVRRTPGNLAYSGTFEDFVLHSNRKVVDFSKGQVVVLDNDFDHPYILSVSWEVEADQFHADSFSVVCPPMMNSTFEQVYGTGIYSDDSKVCAAALHDGRIGINGGQITVRKSPGLWSYVGSRSNGFTSQSRDSPWDTSFVFQNTFYHMATTFTITCDTKGYMIENQEFGVVCPSGCADKNPVIYGDHIYADNSPLCAAGIHAGKITNDGGRLNIKHMEGEKHYKGGTFNGITSFEYGESDISFMVQ